MFRTGNTAESGAPRDNFRELSIIKSNSHFPVRIVKKVMREVGRLLDGYEEV